MATKKDLPENQDDDDGRRGGGKVVSLHGKTSSENHFVDPQSELFSGKREHFYEHSAEIEYEQRKLADEEGHSKFARREKPLVVQDKKRHTAGQGSPLQEHPILGNNDQGVPPALADVFNNPEALEQLLQCDPDDLSAELKQQLSKVPGMANRLQQNKKNSPPTPSPLG